MMGVWGSRIFGGLDDAVKRLEQTGKDLDVTVLLNTAYAVAGLVAVAFIVYGGITYSTSQGSPDKIHKAGQTLAFAIIGLAIVLLATVLTNFVFKSV